MILTFFFPRLFTVKQAQACGPSMGPSQTDVYRPAIFHSFWFVWALPTDVQKKISEFDELCVHFPSAKYRKSKIIVFVNLGEAGVFHKKFRRAFIIHILL